jgi:hypothetical protein
MVQISQHTADALVVDVLKNSLKHVRATIQRLRTQDTLMYYETHDLQQALVMEEHLTAVIRYYLPPDHLFPL